MANVSGTPLPKVDPYRVGENFLGSDRSLIHLRGKRFFLIRKIEESPLVRDRVYSLVGYALLIPIINRLALALFNLLFYSDTRIDLRAFLASRALKKETLSLIETIPQEKRYEASRPLALFLEWQDNETLTKALNSIAVQKRADFLQAAIPYWKQILTSKETTNDYLRFCELFTSDEAPTEIATLFDRIKNYVVFEALLKKVSEFPSQNRLPLLRNIKHDLNSATTEEQFTGIFEKQARPFRLAPDDPVLQSCIKENTKDHDIYILRGWKSIFDDNVSEVANDLVNYVQHSSYREKFREAIQSYGKRDQLSLFKAVVPLLSRLDEQQMVNFLALCHMLPIGNRLHDPSILLPFVHVKDGVPLKGLEKVPEPNRYDILKVSSPLIYNMNQPEVNSLLSLLPLFIECGQNDLCAATLKKFIKETKNHAEWIHFFAAYSSNQRFVYLEYFMKEFHKKGISCAHVYPLWNRLSKECKNREEMLHDLFRYAMSEQDELADVALAVPYLTEQDWSELWMSISLRIHDVKNENWGKIATKAILYYVFFPAEERKRILADPFWPSKEVSRSWLPTLNALTEPGLKKILAKKILRHEWATEPQDYVAILLTAVDIFPTNPLLNGIKIRHTAAAETPEHKKSVEVILGRSVSLQKLIHRSYTYLELLKLPCCTKFEELLAIAEKMRKRLATDSEAQNEIQETTEYTLELLLNTLTEKGSTLKELLMIPADVNSIVSPDVLKFHCICQMIIKADPTKQVQIGVKEGNPLYSRLTEQEYLLCKTLASLKGCEVGQSFNISNLYNQLPDRFRPFQSEGEREDRARVYLMDIVQAVFMDSFAAPNPFMDKYIGEPVTGEFAQFANYAKNFLCTHIGLHHTPQYDPHTGYLYEEYARKELAVALTLFYEYMTPQKLLTEFQIKANHKLETLNEKTVADIQAFAGRTDFFTVQEKEEEIWQTLTEEGAFQLLLKIGAFKLIKK